MIDISFLRDNLLILDGAFGTELEARGYDVNHKLWSALILAQNPDAIYQLHYDYFQSGANIATTCTYQASVPGFLQSGICSSEEEASDLMTKAVQIAKQARDDSKSTTDKPLLVAASIGPYGAYLGTGAEYNGDYGNDITKADLYNFHIPRILAIVKGEPDLIALETIPREDEIEVLLDLLQKYGNNIPFWLSLSVGDAQSLPDRTPISKIISKIESLNPPSLVAIGVNCLPIQNAAPILEQLNTLTNLPLIVYPNSGESYDADSKTWSNNKSSLTLSQNWHDWYQRGARLIGGCCRTTPNDISNLVQAIH